ncbi:MAG: SWIM zinc finger family protein [Acidobacteriota bacterium]
MLVEEQIIERRQRARKEKFAIEPQGLGVFVDYQILSKATKRRYRVALRGLGLYENYCSCPDFAVNTLGTCKHIEAVLLRARGRLGAKLERTRYRRTHATIYLDYGPTQQVRIALPSRISPEMAALRREFFDEKGTLRADRVDRFAGATTRFRSLDEKVVIYSDAIDWIERELESAEGLDFESSQLGLLERGKLPLSNLLQVPVYPFQMRGILFAACRGRTVLADDMGLGKTIQAIGAAELLARRRVGMLLEAGLKLLESLSKPPERQPAAKASLAVQAAPARGRLDAGRRKHDEPRTLSETIEDALEGLIQEDPVTRCPTLTISLPQSLTAERVAQSFAGLLARLTGG